MDLNSNLDLDLVNNSDGMTVNSGQGYDSHGKDWNRGMNFGFGGFRWWVEPEGSMHGGAGCFGGDAEV